VSQAKQRWMRGIFRKVPPNAVDGVHIVFKIM